MEGVHIYKWKPPLMVCSRNYLRTTWKCKQKCKRASYELCITMGKYFNLLNFLRIMSVEELLVLVYEQTQY